jgi:2-succinyl-5-enolpyruvyl-6-hydroxy-3-cyclohexene-1-carboxylate synthase
MTNVNLAERVISSLLAAGVREFCLCAGARNSPFVRFFESNPNLKVYHFFEERSASFFALGRIAATRHPVAVVTTSGTAVAECLAAAVEGTYSSLPLILVTADRPKKYRGSGAPQSIEQVGIFSYYIEASFDLDSSNSHLSLAGLSWRKPIHLNVCFSEPLFDGEIKKINTPEKEYRQKLPEAFPMQLISELDQFLGQQKPVVILSTLPEKSKKSVLTFLKKLRAPVYA